MGIKISNNDKIVAKQLNFDSCSASFNGFLLAAQNTESEQFNTYNEALETAIQVKQCKYYVIEVTKKDNSIVGYVKSGFTSPTGEHTCINPMSAFKRKNMALVENHLKSARYWLPKRYILTLKEMAGA